MSATGDTGRLFARAVAVGVAILFLVPCVALPACGSNFLGSNTQTPTAHSATPAPTLAQALASPSSTDSATGQGTSTVNCAQPGTVTIHPGATIPIYPGAELHRSQANGSNAFYGFCTSATVEVVQNFYAQQLPLTGWTGLQTSTNLPSVQISAKATQSASQVIVTIAPDAAQANTTGIAVVVLAG